MLGPIGRVRQIRQRIKKWDQDQMIRNRAEKRLRGIVAGLNPETVDDKQVTAIETRLDELENWFNSDNLYELYWADLKGDVNTLLTQVDPKAFTEQNQTAVVQGRIDEINKQVQAINNQQSAQSSAQQGAQSSAQQKSNLKDYIKIEWEYAKLKILWERKLEGDGDALGQLCKLIEEKPDITIDAFFQKADDIAWNLLKDACTKENEGQRGLEFISPRRSSIQPLEAYQLIHFEVAPKVRKLANNYLFKHGLEYRWTLKIQSEKEKNNGRPILLTSDRSEEPRIVQFVPKKGKLHVSVELCRNGDCAEAVSLDEPLLIAASRDFGYRSAFRFGEVMAFSLAALLATVSGLGTFYFDEPIFGSVNNYIALFLWGAGVDQTKNFIQNLERVSPQS